VSFGLKPGQAGALRPILKAASLAPRRPDGLIPVAPVVAMTIDSHGRPTGSLRDPIIAAIDTDPCGAIRRAAPGPASAGHDGGDRPRQDGADLALARSNRFPAAATVKTKVFDAQPNETWVYPGHGNDTTQGAERPQLEEWRERGW
jgi:hypothetical protein